MRYELVIEETFSGPILHPSLNVMLCQRTEAGKRLAETFHMANGKFWRAKGFGSVSSHSQGPLRELIEEIVQLDGGLN